MGGMSEAKVGETITDGQMVMKKHIYIIAENRLVAADTYRLVLTGDGKVDGEFVHLEVPGFYLRRPFSVCDATEGRLTLLYKTVGEGTRALATLPEGTEVSAVTGLGKGFDAEACREKALLVGGGLGAAPLYLLRKSRFFTLLARSRLVSGLRSKATWQMKSKSSTSAMPCSALMASRSMP